jgi:hypothetical protein
LVASRKERRRSEMDGFDVDAWLRRADEVDQEFGEEAPAPGTRSQSRKKQVPTKGSAWAFTPNPPPEDLTLQGMSFQRRMRAMGIKGRVDKL